MRIVIIEAGNAVIPTKIKARILLVEDEHPIRTLVAAILKQKGHRVVEAANGAEALRCLDRDPNFDLLITDIRMPQVDGLELTAIIRQWLPDLSILVMSAYPDEEAKALEQGASCFLSKPFSHTKLLAALPTF
jgi:CheY-like chemotaxis protein